MSETDTTESDGGYVHRPDDWEDGERTAEDAPVDDTPADPREEELGRAGWVLVGVVVLAFLVVPGLIYLRPATPAELGFSFFTTMLVLPMVPAALLGATAVWSVTAGRED